MKTSSITIGIYRYCVDTSDCMSPVACTMYMYACHLNILFFLVIETHMTSHKADVSIILMCAFTHTTYSCYYYSRLTIVTHLIYTVYMS